jgi:putative FmdB family regulatory protein
MPFYIFKCDACDHQFTEKLSIADYKKPHGEACPSCGVVGNVQQVIQAPGLSDPFRLGLRKPDNEFSTLLSKIDKKANNPRGGW